MTQTTFQSEIAAPWTLLAPVRVGQSPTGQGTLKQYVTVEFDDGSRLRIDLYQNTSQCFAFEKACIWLNFVVIGWGEHLYLVNRHSLKVIDHALDCYFADFYCDPAFLLAASGQSLFRISPTGAMRWQSVGVGVYGVTIDRVDEETIHGDGEWDPPGDWRPYRLSLSTGLPA